MKKSTLLFVTLLFSVCSYASEFKVVCEVPVTSVKNQYDTGTCWAFAALSFLESEAIRLGSNIDIDFSEKWIVSHAYSHKAERYVMLHGNMKFAQGGCIDDALWVVRNFGLIEQDAMSTLSLDDDLDVMTHEAQIFLDSIISTKGFASDWMKNYKSIIDRTLGELPKVNKSESHHLNLDDYISITSFNHEKAYTRFALELPDNWMWHRYYNLPLDDMISVIDYALMTGYSLAWAGDITEPGFSAKGRAETDIIDVTEFERTASYKDKTTMDDHGMHIFGIAKDSSGAKYYMAKNSWGDSGDYGGIWYISEGYLRHKTVNITLNKHALPEAITQRLESQ